jgi:hypothetical protein
LRYFNITEVYVPTNAPPRRTPPRNVSFALFQYY